LLDFASCASEFAHFWREGGKEEGRKREKKLAPQVGCGQFDAASGEKRGNFLALFAKLRALFPLGCRSLASADDCLLETSFGCKCESIIRPLWIAKLAA